MNGEILGIYVTQTHVHGFIGEKSYTFPNICDMISHVKCSHPKVSQCVMTHISISTQEQDTIAKYIQQHGIRVHTLSPTIAAVIAQYRYIPTTSINTLVVTVDAQSMQIAKVCGTDIIKHVHTDFGGNTLTGIVTNHVQQYIQSKYNIPIPTHKLQPACEQAKRELSFLSQTSIIVQDTFLVPISRAQLYYIARDYFKSIENVFKQFDVSDVCITLLIGGGCRVPKIQQIFGDSVKRVDPGVGAALYGTLVRVYPTHTQQQDQDQEQQWILCEAIGIGMQDGTTHIMIPAHTQLPVSRTSSVFTKVDDLASDIDINVFQGNRRFSSYNTLLTTCVLPQTTNAMPTRITITLHVDTDGMVSIQVCDMSYTTYCKVQLASNSESEDDDEMDLLLEDSMLVSKMHMKNYLQEAYDTCQSIYAQAIQQGIVNDTITKQINAAFTTAECYLKGYTTVSSQLLQEQATLLKNTIHTALLPQE